MDRAVRDSVAQRAGYRCEYCRLPQRFSRSTFHVEHITPRQHGGTDDLDNLCCACNRCNLHKGPNLTGIDPDTGQIVPLFDPRGQSWDEHFAWQGALIVARTATGRATLQVLQMNAPRRLQLRSRLLARGLWP